MLPRFGPTLNGPGAGEEHAETGLWCVHMVALALTQPHATISRTKKFSQIKFYVFGS